MTRKKFFINIIAAITTEILIVIINSLLRTTHPYLNIILILLLLFSMIFIITIYMKSDSHKFNTIRIFVFILFITIPVIMLSGNIYTIETSSSVQAESLNPDVPKTETEHNKPLTNQNSATGWRRIKQFFKTIKKQPASIESSFNQNFPYRTGIVSTYNFYALKYFQKSSNDKVIAGKDGWLFYKGDNAKQTIDDYTGKLRFSQNELEKIRIRLKDYSKILSDKNIKLYVVVAPNKETIYSEYMPESYIRANGSRLKQLTEFLSKKSPEINFINLTDILIKEKLSIHNKYNLYYKTDTHWNDVGAYIAYSHILKQLNMKPIDIKFFTPKEISLSGDIAINMLNCADRISENTINYEPKIKRKAKIINNEDKNFTTITENKTLPNAIFIRDSFSAHLQPFISEHFNRIQWIWEKKHIIDMKLIDEEKPDFVVIEIIERYLPQLLSL